MLERGLDAVVDESERGASLLGHGLSRVVGEDEHRHAEGRVVAPPAVRVRVVLPWPLAPAEHAPAHHDGAGRAQRLRDDLVVGASLAARQVVPLAKGREPEEPLVEVFAAGAQRLLERLVRSGDEPVE